MPGRRPQTRMRMDTPAPFRPPRWLTNRHAQTLFTSSPLCRPPTPRWRREIVELPDGDFAEAHWHESPADEADEVGVTLVLLHGLEGSSDATYARMMAVAAAERGWRLVVLHARDCGEHRNRLPRRYHAGETADLRYFMQGLAADGGNGRFIAAGYSLGGNMLLKYLGEEAEQSPFTAAAAVSVPFDLQDSADALNRGFSRFYRWYLLRRMKAAMRRKFSATTAPFDWQAALRARDFVTFDDIVTAPLHGFRDAAHYYDECSSGRYLGRIRTPTLVLNAKDDPFMSPAVTPAAADLPDPVRLEITDSGGHIGFVAGPVPWKPSYWMPGRLLAWFEQALSAADSRRP